MYDFFGGINSGRHAFLDNEAVLTGVLNQKIFKE